MNSDATYNFLKIFLYLLIPDDGLVKPKHAACLIFSFFPSGTIQCGPCLPIQSFWIPYDLWPLLACFYFHCIWVVFNLVSPSFIWSPSLTCSFSFIYCNLYWYSLVLHFQHDCTILARWISINFTLLLALCPCFFLLSSILLLLWTLPIFSLHSTFHIFWMHLFLLWSFCIFDTKWL